MSMFRRLFKSNKISSVGGSHKDLVEAVGLILLAGREKRDGSLRHSPRLGELLGLLWQDDPQARTAVYDAFSSVERLDRGFIESLGLRLRTEQTAPPPTPESRYGAVVQALRAELTVPYTPATKRIYPNADTQRILSTLTLARILLPAELHQPICTFLLSFDKLYPLAPNAADYLQLVPENIFRFLASISPNEMPTFWAMLRDETVSQEFWPALRRIRDKAAVPYLLEMLPAADDEEGVSAMSMDGQKEIIQALREIGDLRAVAVLLAIEKRPLPPPPDRPGIQSAWDRALSAKWRERNELARVAGQAARHILRNSDAAEAQLLRPSDLPIEIGGRLLRPSQPEQDTTAPEELMRPSNAPQNPKRTL